MLIPKFNGLGKEAWNSYLFGNTIQRLCISSVIYILLAPLIQSLRVKIFIEIGNCLGNHFESNHFEEVEY